MKPRFSGFFMPELKSLVEQALWRPELSRHSEEKLNKLPKNLNHQPRIMKSTLYKTQ
jgi:hypothetical protein